MWFTLLLICLTFSRVKAGKIVIDDQPLFDFTNDEIISDVDLAMAILRSLSYSAAMLLVTKYINRKKKMQLASEYAMQYGANIRNTARSKGVQTNPNSYIYDVNYGKPLDVQLRGCVDKKEMDLVSATFLKQLNAMDKIRSDIKMRDPTTDEMEMYRMVSENSISWSAIKDNGTNFLGAVTFVFLIMFLLTVLKTRLSSFQTITNYDFENTIWYPIIFATLSIYHLVSRFGAFLFVYGWFDLIIRKLKYFIVVMFFICLGIYNVSHDLLLLTFVLCLVVIVITSIFIGKYFYIRCRDFHGKEFMDLNDSRYINYSARTKMFLTIWFTTGFYTFYNCLDDYWHTGNVRETLIFIYVVICLIGLFLYESGGIVWIGYKPISVQTAAWIQDQLNERYDDVDSYVVKKIDGRPAFYTYNDPTRLTKLSEIMRKHTLDDRTRLHLHSVVNTLAGGVWTNLDEENLLNKAVDLYITHQIPVPRALVELRATPYVKPKKSYFAELYPVRETNRLSTIMAYIMVTFTMFMLVPGYGWLYCTVIFSLSALFTFAIMVLFNFKILLPFVTHNGCKEYLIAASNKMGYKVYSMTDSQRMEVEMEATEGTSMFLDLQWVVLLLLISFSFLLYIITRSSSFHTIFSYNPLSLLPVFSQLSHIIRMPGVNVLNDTIKVSAATRAVLAQLEKDTRPPTLELSRLSKSILDYFSNYGGNPKDLNDSEGLYQWCKSISPDLIKLAQGNEYWGTYFPGLSNNRAYERPDPVINSLGCVGPADPHDVAAYPGMEKLQSYNCSIKGEQQDRCDKNPYASNLCKIFPNLDKKTMQSYCVTIPNNKDNWAGYVTRRGFENFQDLSGIDEDWFAMALAVTIQEMSIRKVGASFRRTLLQDYVDLPYNPKSTIGNYMRAKYPGKKQAFIYTEDEGIREVASHWVSLVTGGDVYVSSDTFGKFETKKVKEPKEKMGLNPPDHGNFIRIIVAQDGRTRTVAATMWVPAHVEFMANCDKLCHAIGQLFYGKNGLAASLVLELDNGMRGVYKDDMVKWDGHCWPLLMLTSAVVEFTGFEPRDAVDAKKAELIYWFAVRDGIYTVEELAGGDRFKTTGRVCSGHGNTSTGNSIDRNYITNYSIIRDYMSVRPSEKLVRLANTFRGKKYTTPESYIFEGKDVRDIDWKILDHFEINRLNKHLCSFRLISDYTRFITKKSGGDDSNIGVPKGLMRYITPQRLNEGYKIWGHEADATLSANSVEELNFYSHGVRRVMAPPETLRGQFEKLDVLYREPQETIGRMCWVKNPLNYNNDGTLAPESEALIAGIVQSLLITNFCSKSVRLVARYILKHLTKVESKQNPNGISIIYPAGWKWQKLMGFDKLPARVLTDAEIWKVFTGRDVPDAYVDDLPVVDDEGDLFDLPFDIGRTKDDIFNAFMFAKAPREGLKEWLTKNMTSIPTNVWNARLATKEVAASVLPVQQQANRIINMVENNKFVVVTADTGSGKSTQIPQILHRMKGNNKPRCVYVVQPRVLAARALATRVAKEMKTTLGNVVGFITRQESNFSPENTKVCYITDGVATRMCLDSTFDKRDILVIDEAHERTVNIDTTLALVKRNPEMLMKCIVMSATMDSALFTDYLSCPNIHVEGRMYPIDIHYEETDILNVINRIKEVILHIHMSPTSGDILVFVAGEREIEEVFMTMGKRNRDFPEGKQLEMLKLMASTTDEDQNKILSGVVSPGYSRRCIVATNVAETSLTIPNIVHVIDTGKVKETIFDFEHEVTVLNVHQISRARADQRAGRAGRVMPGHCHRLYTKTTFNSMLLSNLPAILKEEVTDDYLLLRTRGIPMEMVPYITRPYDGAVRYARQRLMYLDLIDSTYNVTSLGREIANFPTSVTEAIFLYDAALAGCYRRACDAIAGLDQTLLVVPGQSLAANQRELVDGRSELLTTCNVLSFYRANENNASALSRYRLHKRNCKTAANVSLKLYNKIRNMSFDSTKQDGGLDVLWRVAQNCKALYKVERRVDKSLRLGEDTIRINSNQGIVSTARAYTCFSFFKASRLNMVGATVCV